MDMKSRSRQVACCRSCRGAGDLHAALCHFSAGESIEADDTSDPDDEDVPLFEINATYLIALQSDAAVPTPELRQRLADAAVSSAWPLFRTLFAQAATQATIDLPMLPLKPDLDWDDDVETIVAGHFKA